MWRPSFALAVRYGADKIAAAVYRYGPPPTISALAALLKDDKAQEQWQTYVANVGCRLVRLVSRGKDKSPFYSEIVQRRNKKTDSRTGQEIVDSIVARRRKKRRRVEVKNTETL